MKTQLINLKAAMERTALLRAAASGEYAARQGSVMGRSFAATSQRLANALPSLLNACTKPISHALKQAQRAYSHYRKHPGFTPQVAGGIL